MRSRLGMIGSLVNAATVVLFAICMLIPFDLGSYFVCIFLALSFVVMTAAFEDECDDNNRLAGKIATVFSGVYAVLILIVYFTQCTTVANEQLNEQAAVILNYKYMGLLFNLDLLGYGIMGLSTFFTGLTVKAENKKDKALKILLLVHGIFFVSCLIMPMTGVFAGSDGSDSIGGTIALECWCLYFLPISVLSFLHFRNNKCVQ